MNDKQNEDADWLISALEGICKQLEDSGSKSEAQIEAELQAAKATVKSAIEQTVDPEDREVWKTELERLTGDTASAKPKIEGAGEKRTEAGNPADSCCNCGKPLKRSDGKASLINCIHGCDAAYCSASCRRGQNRTHRPHCEALRRKSLLKQLGLSEGDELF